MSILEQIISLLAPHDCIVCGREGAVLCDACAPLALQPLPARCYRCRRASDVARTCSSCRSQSSLTHVWVRTEYSGTARELVRQLKFSYVRAATTPIVGAMVESLPPIPSHACIVPVPTASSRVRERGYDQAKLLAHMIARRVGVRNASLLNRLGQTRQVGTRRIQRLQQSQDVFLVRRPNLVKGAHIILVDDVLTTGATLEAAALTLRKAGAKHVDAIVFAQT